MKKSLFFILLFLMNYSFSQLNKQSSGYSGKTLEVGSSLTYIWDDNNRPQGDFLYSELTWNVNFKMKIQKRIWIGVQAAPIFTRTKEFSTVEKENYNLLGCMVQFDFLSTKNAQLFGEISLNHSNFFRSNFSNPIKMKGINYLGFGGGANLLLNKKGRENLFLELAFFNYHILNEISNKSNYTQYIIGLNYRLGKK